MKKYGILYVAAVVFVTGFVILRSPEFWSLFSGGSAVQIQWIPLVCYALFAAALQTVFLKSPVARLISAAVFCGAIGYMSTIRPDEWGYRMAGMLAPTLFAVFALRERTAPARGAAAQSDKALPNKTGAFEKVYLIAASLLGLAGLADCLIHAQRLDFSLEYLRYAVAILFAYACYLWFLAARLKKRRLAKKEKKGGKRKKKAPYPAPDPFMLWFCLNALLFLKDMLYAWHYRSLILSVMPWLLAVLAAAKIGVPEVRESLMRTLERTMEWLRGRDGSAV